MFLALLFRPWLQIFNRFLGPLYMQSSDTPSDISSSLHALAPSLSECANLLLIFMDETSSNTKMDAVLDEKIQRVVDVNEAGWSKLIPLEKFHIFSVGINVRKTTRRLPKSDTLESFFNEFFSGDYQDHDSFSTSFALHVLFMKAQILVPTDLYPSDDSSNVPAQGLLELISFFLDGLRARHTDPSFLKNREILDSRKTIQRLQETVRLLEEQRALDVMLMEEQRTADARRHSEEQKQHASDILVLTTRCEQFFIDAERRTSQSAPEFTESLHRPVEEQFPRSHTPAIAKIDSPRLFFALAAGKHTGIFLDEETAQAQMHGLKYAKLRKFRGPNAFAQATEWLHQFGLDASAPPQLSPPSLPAAQSGIIPLPAIIHTAPSSCFDDGASSLSNSSSFPDSSNSDSAEQNTKSKSRRHRSRSTHSRSSRSRSSRSHSRHNRHSRRNRQKRSKLLDGLRMDFPLDSSVTPISMDALLNAATSAKGLIIMTITGSLVRYRFNAKDVNLSNGQFKYSTLVGSRSNPDPDSLGINGTPQFIFPRSRAAVHEFFREQRRFLTLELTARHKKVDQHTSGYTDPLSAAAAAVIAKDTHSTWSRAQADHLQRYQDAIASLMDRVLGREGKEINSAHHISIMAALSHLMLVHWNSALAADKPEMLGVKLADQWDNWYKQSLVCVDNRPTQPLSTSMLFLGYCCLKCKAAGWSEEFCHGCATYGPAKAVSTAVKDAAYAAWIKVHAGKSKGDWHKSDSFKSLKPQSTTHDSAHSAYEALAADQRLVRALGCVRSY
jgi:hypothetical protein